MRTGRPPQRASQLTSGLGLLPGVIIDQHSDERQGPGSARAPDRGPASATETTQPLRHANHPYQHERPDWSCPTQRRSGAPTCATSGHDGSLTLFQVRSPRGPDDVHPRPPADGAQGCLRGAQTAQDNLDRRSREEQVGPFQNADLGHRHGCSVLVADSSRLSLLPVPSPQPWDEIKTLGPWQVY